jgi:hypothetical protein
MSFGNVYNTILNVVLSTAIYLDCVDKGCWDEHKAGIALLIGLQHVELSA